MSRAQAIICWHFTSPVLILGQSTWDTMSLGQFSFPEYFVLPIPMAARSNVYFCARSIDGIGGGGFESRGGNGWLSVVNVVCWQVDFLCDGPILRPEECYRACVCVIYYDQLQH